MFRRLNSRGLRRAGLLLAASAVASLMVGAAQAEARIKAGSLVCAGSGGWGAVITSRKEFRCTYESASGTVR